jgi:hypothetical protein
MLLLWLLLLFVWKKSLPLVCVLFRACFCLTQKTVFSLVSSLFLCVWPPGFTYSSCLGKSKELVQGFVVLCGLGQKTKTLCPK